MLSEKLGVYAKKLAATTRRLSKAERLSTIQSASSQTGCPNGTANPQPQTNGTPRLPESAVMAILELNQQAEQAEVTLRFWTSSAEPEPDLGMIELRTADARAGFACMAGSVATSPEFSTHTSPSDPADRNFNGTNSSSSAHVQPQTTPGYPLSQ